MTFASSFCENLNGLGYADFIRSYPKQCVRLMVRKPKLTMLMNYMRRLLSYDE